jgi:hypothetical protein
VRFAAIISSNVGRGFGLGINGVENARHQRQLTPIEVNKR